LLAKAKAMIQSVDVTSLALHIHAKVFGSRMGYGMMVGS